MLHHRVVRDQAQNQNNEIIGSKHDNVGSCAKLLMMNLNI